MTPIHRPPHATPRTEPGDCPRCGCNDSDVESQGRRVTTKTPKGGGPKVVLRDELVQRRRCNHCGDSFQAAWPWEEPKPPAVDRATTWPDTVCPGCGASGRDHNGASMVPVTSTRGAVRHHRCNRCARRFKSTKP